MSYTVVWKPQAERDLGEIWLQGRANRNAIATAAIQIDSDLRTAPERVGADYGDPYRMLFTPPLLVAFRVSAADRLVTVLRIAAIE